MSKKELLLSELRKYEWMERVDKNIYKAKAYAKVIKGIEKLANINTIDDLQSVEGIGDSIREKCNAVLQSGNTFDKKRDAVGLIQNIYGIGPVKAYELVNVYKMYTFEDVRKNSDLLTPVQKIGLKYVEDSMLRIPREEMDSHSAKLQSILQLSTNGKLVGCIVGSYRRKKESSGDIDMCITYQHSTSPGEYFETFIKECQKNGYILDILAKGRKKCLCFCRLQQNLPVRRLDLLLTPPEEFVTSLLYFTGSQEFNIRMRSRALELGYTMNEHSITPMRKDIPHPPFFSKEEEVFSFLKMDYVPPDKR